MEKEPVSFTVQEMTAEDIAGVTEMRMQSWRDTYPNEKHGVTLEWINQQHGESMSPEVQKRRVERFLEGKQKGTLNSWVAKDSSGKIIGAATPFIEEDGTRRVGSLYVAKEWYGMGVGNELMQCIIDWYSDEKPIYLEVASYNDRAKRFYEKWGFEKVQGSEKLHRDRMPVLTMRRMPKE